MAYPVSTYRSLTLQDQHKRFTNLENLLKLNIRFYNRYKRIAEDPEYAKELLEKEKSQIEDIKQDMQNLIEAMKG